MAVTMSGSAKAFAELCAVSTKTTLEPLLEAIRELNKELGVKLNPKIFYTHQLDEADEALKRSFSKAL